MMRVNVLRAADRKPTPWKNGSGRTSEVVVFPAGAGFDDFEWRISMASVTEPARFSHFGEVDRVLAVIEGRLDLAFDGGADPVSLGSGSVPIRLPGDIGVVGTPIDGDVIDLNLMTRRGRWEGSVERITTPGDCSVACVRPHSVIMFLGACTVRSPAGIVAMHPFDAVQIDTDEGARVAITSNLDVCVLRLSPVRLGEGASVRPTAPTAP